LGYYFDDDDWDPLLLLDLWIGINNSLREKNVEKQLVFWGDTEFYYMTVVNYDPNYAGSA
jgi:hypothetical protein